MRYFENDEIENVNHKYRNTSQYTQNVLVMTWAMAVKHAIINKALMH